jgi:hypothetical protein
MSLFNAPVEWVAGVVAGHHLAGVSGAHLDASGHAGDAGDAG